MITSNKKQDKYGFRAFDLEQMNEIFKSFNDLEKVFIFGSRAMGNFKKGSDVDLAIVCKKDSDRIASKLKGKLEEETNIPYFFDVVDLNVVTSKDLKEHVWKFGEVIYKKNR